MAWGCPNCGQENVVDGFPCFRCGMNADGTKPKKQRPRKRGHALKSFGAVLLVLALGGVGAYMYTARTGGKAATSGDCRKVGTPTYGGDGSDAMVAYAPEGYSGTSSS